MSDKGHTIGPALTEVVSVGMMEKGRELMWAWGGEKKEECAERRAQTLLEAAFLVHHHHAFHQAFLTTAGLIS